ncbi:hypothetical protein OYC64_022029 [Pagothenia borchgrevinki]|uniref:Uncharacterized protein n=1 Tax=Pagothenia borchgrevinki TaxID=8213 RepID=A0ABD2G207_PAGBO
MFKVTEVICGRELLLAIMMRMVLFFNSIIMKRKLCAGVFLSVGSVHGCIIRLYEDQAYRRKYLNICAVCVRLSVKSRVVYHGLEIGIGMLRVDETVGNGNALCTDVV